MADKKKENPAPKKGVVGFLKQVVKRNPKDAAGTKPNRAAKPKQAKPKTEAKPKSEVKRKAKTKSEAKPEKTVAAPKTKKGAPPPPPKKKPPSITITRPEATRPPLVQMPTPKKEAPAGVPNILLPKGGLPVDSLTPSLRWMYVGGATHYEVEWSHDSHFGRGHSSSLISQQTLVKLDAEHALKPGTVYQWRVRGGNDSGWGPWSGAESFRSPDKA